MPTRTLHYVPPRWRCSWDVRPARSLKLWYQSGRYWPAHSGFSLRRPGTRCSHIAGSQHCRWCHFDLQCRQVGSRRGQVFLQRAGWWWPQGLLGQRGGLINRLGKNYCETSLHFYYFWQALFLIIRSSHLLKNQRWIQAKVSFCFTFWVHSRKVSCYLLTANIYIYLMWVSNRRLRLLPEQGPLGGSLGAR